MDSVFCNHDNCAVHLGGLQRSGPSHSAISGALSGFRQAKAHTKRLGELLATEGERPIKSSDPKPYDESMVCGKELHVTCVATKGDAIQELVRIE